MRKAVIDELRNRGMTIAQAKAAFETVETVIGDLLERGERVRLDRVGTLVRKHRAESRKRNPRTGEPITVAGYDVVALRKARRFK